MELDLQLAMGLIERAKSAASETGVPVIIAVVDPAANLKAFARMDADEGVLKVVRNSSSLFSKES